MKTYRITVNNEIYTVTVEEVQPGTLPLQSAAPVAMSAPQSVAPASVAVAAPQPKPVPAQIQAATPKTASMGGQSIQAPMPGKILSLKVKVGDTVKRGTVLLVLEAMKMENDILAPADGTIQTVNIGVGATVNTGEVLIVIG